MDDSKAIFFQTDRRWSGKKLGGSSLTIGGYGCTITSIARICYLMTGVVYTPDILAKKFSFTEDGLLIWESVQNIGLKASRVRGNPSMELLTEKAGKMIIGINGVPPAHWVAVESIGAFGAITVMDPMKGNTESKRSQPEITAYTTFESMILPEKPVIIDDVPDWKDVANGKSAKQIWDIAKEKGYVSKNSKFNTPKSAGEMMIFLARLFPEKF